MFDELRAMDWVPRSTREKSKQIERTIADLVGRYGRFPTDAEVADRLEWNLEKYHKALDEVSGTTLLSLDEIIITSPAGDTVTRLDALREESEHPLGRIERTELLDRLVEVIGSLAEQERLVIALYYYEELTLKEIGMVLKVSESRVSQVHTSAILKIRAKINAMYA